MENKQLLEIHMFGEFSLSLDGKAISSKEAHSHKLWLLMQYLIIRRGHIAGQKELIEILWPNSEISNPQNSLKTLVFRLRKQLDKLGCIGASVVVQLDGGYAFNEKCHYSLDIEDFELQCRLARAASSPQTKLKLLTQAIDVFDGSVLAQNQNELWAQEVFTQYNILFRKVVQEAVELLIQSGDYPRVVAICRDALSVQPYEEIFHSLLVNALVSMEDFSEASRQYALAYNLFHDSLSVSPIISAPTREKSCNISATDTIADLQKTLSEEYNFGYSYYCAFDVFRSVYHMLARRLYRLPEDAFLALFRIDRNNLYIESDPKQHDSIHMRMLGEAIAFSLRQSDIFTLHGDSSFLVIFESVSKEQISGIATRIEKYFNQHKTRDDLEIHLETLPILPSLPLTGKMDSQ
ncbi:MAG: BTAD domain-containing putative transcriptional regulator [Oscillospiraceae bacterium]